MRNVREYHLYLSNNVKGIKLVPQNRFQITGVSDLAKSINNSELLY